MRDSAKQVDNALQIQVPNYTTKNLDSETLTTTKFGLLTPTFLMETVPGGKYNLGCEVLTRFPPLASPLMHRCMQKTMYFFVPYRILWDNWENFIMQKNDPLTGLPVIHPYYKASDLFAIGTGANGVSTARIADYFGFKTPDGGYGSLVTMQMNPFPYAAYQAIYNRWFRHKTVEEPIDYMLEDGLVSPSDLGLMLIERIATFEEKVVHY